MSITLPYVMSDGSVIDFNRSPLDLIPVGFGLAPAVVTLPATNPDRYVRDCNLDVDDANDVCTTPDCDHEYYLATKNHRGSYIVMPIPDLVQPEAVRSGRDDELVPDTLRAAYDDNGTLLVKQVMLDGVSGFGVETLDIDALTALLPTFVISYTRTVTATCMGDHDSFTRTGKPVRVPCNVSVSLRDFATQTVVCDATRKAFVAGLLEHTQEHHAQVTADQMCEHGERNFVQAKARATGQMFTAYFCKRGQSRTACDAKFLNTYGTDDQPSGLFAVTPSGMLG